MLVFKALIKFCTTHRLKKHEENVDNERKFWIKKSTS